MDSLDLKIVKMLEKNGRISHEEIAKQLHMSRPAIHKRIENLEKMGIITGYRAVIDWRKVSPCFRCLITLQIKGRYFNKIADEVTNLDIPGIVVEEFHRLAGEWCVLIKARVTTPEDTTKILDRVWQLEGIIKSSTSFITLTVL